MTEVYPAYDLALNAIELGYDAYCDYLPDKECVDYETVSINNAGYDYGTGAASEHTAIIQARILAKDHARLRMYLDYLEADFDGQTVTMNGTTYEVFVNTIAYQGFRSTGNGLFRYAVATMTLHY